MRNRDITKIIGVSRLRIPSLPIVAVKALLILDLESPNTDDLVKTIYFDQSFVSHLLKVANSPYFSRGNSVSSIEEAIMHIGFDTARNLVVVSALKDFRRANDIIDCGLWEHTTAVAVASRLIAEELGSGSPEEHFIHGLLHDIGKMVININFKEKYKAVIDEVRSSGKAFEDVESAVFGFTHCDMGDYVASKWNLPVKIRSAISLHHCAASEIADHKDIFDVLLVKAANYICSELQIGIYDNYDFIGNDLELIGLKKPSQLDSIKEKVKEQYEQFKSFILEG